MRNGRALIAIAATAALIAGCGAPAAKPSTATAESHGVAYSACMRAHGVPDFPDPRNGGFNTRATPGMMVVNGVTLKEGASRIQTAQEACRQHEDAGVATSKPPARMVKQALAFATCMRSHGVPNFPDPKVKGGSISEAVPASVGQSPNFQSAQRACQSLVPGGR